MATHETEPVDAQSVPSVALHVYDTDGDGLMLHPNSPTLHSTTTDNMQCWKVGDTVQKIDKKTKKITKNRMWQYGTNKLTGHTGYAADAYINIHWEKPEDLVAQGIPECGTQLPVKTTPNPSPAIGDVLQPAEKVQPFVSYDRNTAASWAIAHAMDKPPDAGSCTYFVSRTMEAGKFPQDKTWNLKPVGVTSELKVRSGSDAAKKTVNYLKYMQSLPYVQYEEIGKLDDTKNNLPDAHLGDIILYDWDGRGEVDHAAVVTGASRDNPQYPLVSGWSEDGAKALTYSQRGWTYSEKNHEFIQLEKEVHGNTVTYPNQNMKAFLLHIRTQEDVKIG